MDKCRKVLKADKGGIQTETLVADLFSECAAAGGMRWFI